MGSRSTKVSDGEQAGDNRIVGRGTDAGVRSDYIKGFKTGQGPASPKNWRPNRPKPGELATAREARRLAEQIRQRDTRRREWQAILAHLGRATAKQVEAYRSHILGGKTIKQVAESLGVSEDATKARIKAARVHEARSRRRAKIA